MDSPNVSGSPRAQADGRRSAHRASKGDGRPPSEGTGSDQDRRTDADAPQAADFALDPPPTRSDQLPEDAPAPVSED